MGGGGADTGGDGATVFWRGMVGMCWRGVLKMGGSQRRDRLSPAERARLRAFHCLSSELFSRSLVYQRKMTRMQQMAFPQRSTPVQVQKENVPPSALGVLQRALRVAVLLASLTDGLPTMPFVKMPPPSRHALTLTSLLQRSHGDSPPRCPKFYFVHSVAISCVSLYACLSLPLTPPFETRLGYF